MGVLCGAEVVRYQAGLAPDSPEQRGYRAGVSAAWVRLQKLEKFGREQALRDQDELIAEHRRSAHQEAPY